MTAWRLGVFAVQEFREITITRLSRELAQPADPRVPGVEDVDRARPVDAERERIAELRLGREAAVAGEALETESGDGDEVAVAGADAVDEGARGAAQQVGGVTAVADVEVARRRVGGDPAEACELPVRDLDGRAGREAP